MSSGIVVPDYGLHPSVGGVRCHVEPDGSIGIEVRPTKNIPQGQALGGIVVGLLGAMAPIIAGWWLWRTKGDPTFLIIPAVLLPVVVGVFVWFFVQTGKWVVNIRACREWVSVERCANSDFERDYFNRWYREEIQDLVAEKESNVGRQFGVAGNWSVMLQIPLLKVPLVEHIRQEECELIVKQLREMLGLDDIQRPLPVIAEDRSAVGQASALPLQYADTAMRLGIIVDKRAHRLVIIVPGSKLASLFSDARVVIEVSEESFIVECPTQGDSNHRGRYCWPRGLISDVRSDLYGMGLTIRVTGKEMFELMHNQPESLRREITGILRDELGLP